MSDLVGKLAIERKFVKGKISALYRVLSANQ
jgi:hypothetical protein